MSGGPFYKHSLDDCNSVTVCARDKIQMVSDRREDKLYRDVSQQHKTLPLSERISLNTNRKIDFTMCASHYHHSSNILG